MNRYRHDPKAPSHLRRLMESARGDHLDAERRRRVAERLGITPMVLPRPPSSATARSSWLSARTMTLTALVFIGGAAGTQALSRTTGTAEPRPSVAAPAPEPTPEEPAPSQTNVVAPPRVEITAEARAAGVASIDVAQLPNASEAAAAALRPSSGPAAHRESMGATTSASVPAAAAPSGSVAPAAPAAPAAPVAPAAPAPSASAASESSDLHLEIIALDGVHRAIEAGRPRDALASLDEYKKRFPAGKLREEATVLRIEALHAGGDQQAAERLAERLFRDSPNTPYAARIRAALVQAPRE